MFEAHQYEEYHRPPNLLYIGSTRENINLLNIRMWAKKQRLRYVFLFGVFLLFVFKQVEPGRKVELIGFIAASRDSVH